MMAPTSQADWSPTDWPESLEELRTIDNLLRCSICYEYFDTAVLFQECSHNYCSLCIRQAMVYVPQCPTCFEKTSGNDLKCNRVLDQLVKNFINVRSKLLDIIKKASGVVSATEKKENLNELSDDSASNFETTPARRLHLKRKTKKGKTCITPRNKRKRPKLVNSDSGENIDSEDNKNPQTVEVDPVKSPESVNSSVTSQPATNSSFVECPVCGEFISSNTINSHLDLCLITGEKKRSLRRKATETQAKTEPVTTMTNPNASSITVSSFTKSPLRTAASSLILPSQSKTTNKVAGSNALISDKVMSKLNEYRTCGPKRRKPIPGIVYAILSDKQLKQKLKEWNLSVQGDRKTLIKRHQEFVVLYNAQCDSVNPKPASAIVKELEARGKKRHKNLTNYTSTGSNIHLTKDASEEEVNEANKQYVQQNKGQFENLISEIRNRKKPTTSTKSAIVIHELDSSKKNITKDPSIDQSQLHNQEIRGKRCEEDKSTVMAQTTISGSSSPLLKSCASQSLNILAESRTSVACDQLKLKDGDKEDTQKFETEDQRSPNSDIPSDKKFRQNKDCSEFLGTDTKRNIEDKKHVPEAPLISNLASISGSDDTDDTNKKDEEGGDETDDIEHDEDWEMIPSFAITSSNEVKNDVEDCESDEDLFAPTMRRVIKTTCLTRKK